MGGLYPENTTGTVRRWFVTLAVFFGLVGGGAGMGAWVTYQKLRADHLSEIERLQTAYGMRVGETADAVKEAAQTAERAADKASTAVEASKNPPLAKPAQEPRK